MNPRLFLLLISRSRSTAFLRVSYLSVCISTHGIAPLVVPSQAIPQIRSLTYVILSILLALKDIHYVAHRPLGPEPAQRVPTLWVGILVPTPNLAPPNSVGTGLAGLRHTPMFHNQITKKLYPLQGLVALNRARISAAASFNPEGPFTPIQQILLSFRNQVN